MFAHSYKLRSIKLNPHKINVHMYLVKNLTRWRYQLLTTPPIRNRAQSTYLERNLIGTEKLMINVNSRVISYIFRESLL